MKIDAPAVVKRMATARHLMSRMIEMRDMAGAAMRRSLSWYRTRGLLVMMLISISSTLAQK